MISRKQTNQIDAVPQSMKMPFSQCKIRKRKNYRVDFDDFSMNHMFAENRSSTFDWLVSNVRIIICTLGSLPDAHLFIQRWIWKRTDTKKL